MGPLSGIYASCTGSMIRGRHAAGLDIAYFLRTSPGSAMSPVAGGVMTVAGAV